MRIATKNNPQLKKERKINEERNRQLSRSREKDKRNRSDENENDPEKWHCHGGSKVAKRNDVLSEGRIELRTATVSATRVDESGKCLEESCSLLAMRTEFYTRCKIQTQATLAT